MKELHGLRDKEGCEYIILVDDTGIFDANKYIVKKVEMINHFYLESNFKIGQWVNHKGDIYRIKEIEKDGWCDGDTPGGGWNKNSIYLATAQEIEEHLKKICDKKYIGKRIDRYIIDKFYKYYAELDEMEYSFKDSELVCQVYRQGRWAEIISDKKKLPKTKEETVILLEQYSKFIKGYISDNVAQQFLIDYED
jgi:hypothetical protein